MSCGIHTVTPPGKLAREELYCPLRKRKKTKEDARNLDGSLRISYKVKCNTTSHVTYKNKYVLWQRVVKHVALFHYA
jgi:hypothetical protein